MAILSILPLSAQATIETTWSLTSSTLPGGITSAQAFSTAQTTSTTGGAKFQSAALQSWGSSGLGVASTGDYVNGTVYSPDHAFDNDGRGGNSSGQRTDYGIDGAVDAALFSFAQSVQLTQLSVGWIGSASSYTSPDADLSVLAYTRDNAVITDANILNKSFADLLNDGWEFIGSYNMTYAAKDINSIERSSSYWLISAYTAAAGSGNDSDSALDFNNDYFKLASLTGVPGSSGGSSNNGSVPEPSSLLLLAGGILGWRLNRYHNAQPQADACMAA